MLIQQFLSRSLSLSASYYRVCVCVCAYICILKTKQATETTSTSTSTTTTTTTTTTTREVAIRGVQRQSTKNNRETGTKRASGSVQLASSTHQLQRLIVREKGQSQPSHFVTQVSSRSCLGKCGRHIGSPLSCAHSQTKYDATQRNATPRRADNHDGYDSDDARLPG